MIDRVTIHGEQPDAIVARLRRVYASATPDRAARGLSWYERAYQDTVGVALAENPALCCAWRLSAALAILSPRCPWEVNVEAFHSLCRGEWPDTGRVIGRNVAKAQKVLSGDIPPHRALATPKVFAFARCVYWRGKTDEVCVDSHALRAALGREPTRLEEGRHFHNTAGLYDRLADCYYHAAREEIVYPAQFQAVVWLVQREGYREE